MKTLLCALCVALCTRIRVDFGLAGTLVMRCFDLKCTDVDENCIPDVYYCPKCRV